MPLIKPRTSRVRAVRHICRLQEPNRDALVQYARFIDDTVDYVLNQLIDTTLRKDRDFLAWCAARPAVSPTESTEHEARDGSRSRTDPHAGAALCKK